jgi:magnesium-transporting ATPase (P-type)
MTFKKCSIRGQFYGEHVDEADGPSVWSDRRLLDEINGKVNVDVEHFFSLLAVCHTVVSENINGQLVYQAESPDEYALVTAARSFGFEFRVRRDRPIESNFVQRLRLRIEHKRVSPCVSPVTSKRSIC